MPREKSEPKRVVQPPTATLQLNPSVHIPMVQHQHQQVYGYHQQQQHHLYGQNGATINPNMRNMQQQQFPHTIHSNGRSLLSMPVSVAPLPIVGPATVPPATQSASNTHVQGNSNGQMSINQYPVTVPPGQHHSNNMNNLQQSPYHQQYPSTVSPQFQSQLAPPQTTHGQMQQQMQYNQHQQQQQQRSYPYAYAPYSPFSPSLGAYGDYPSMPSSIPSPSPLPIQDFTLDTEQGQAWLQRASVTSQSQEDALEYSRQLIAKELEARSRKEAERRLLQQEVPASSLPLSPSPADATSSFPSTSSGAPTPTAAGGRTSNKRALDDAGSSASEKRATKRQKQSAAPPPQEIAEVEDVQYEVERLLAKRIRLVPRKTLKRCKEFDSLGRSAEEVCAQDLDELIEDEEQSMRKDRSGLTTTSASAAATSPFSSTSQSKSVPRPLYTLINPQQQLPLVEYRIRWKGYTSADDTWEARWNIHHGMVVEFEHDLLEARKRSLAASQRPTSSLSSSPSGGSYSDLPSDLVLHPNRSHIDPKTLKSKGYNVHGEPLTTDGGVAP